MNSTKLVLKNWFHFNFFLFYCYFLPLGISFAHKRIVYCLRCLEPSEKGGFSPAPCTSPLRDHPSSVCLCGLTDLWLCYSQKGLCQGRTGITRILFKYPEDTAGGMPESQGGQTLQQWAVLSRAGGKGWFSGSAAP